MKGQTVTFSCPMTNPHRTHVEWKNPDGHIMFFNEGKGKDSMSRASLTQETRQVEVLSHWTSTVQHETSTHFMSWQLSTKPCNHTWQVMSIIADFHEQGFQDYYKLCRLFCFPPQITLHQSAATPHLWFLLLKYTLKMNISRLGPGFNDNYLFLALFLAKWSSCARVRTQLWCSWDRFKMSTMTVTTLKET